MSWRRRLAVVLLGSLVVPVLGCRSPGSGGAARPPAPSPSPPPAPAVDEGSSVAIDCGGTKPLTVTVSPDIPSVPVFAVGSPGNLDTIQCGFDVFSWNSFLAVNHSPAGGFGGEGGDNRTVWQAWPAAGDIFLPGGAEPAAWPDGQPPPAHDVPAACQGIDPSATLVLSQIAKRPNILESANEPFESGPLIDTHGYYARFEITVNQEMYQYILDNELYSQTGQSAFSTAGKTVSFPCGCVIAGEHSGANIPHDCPEGGQQGAIMVKASWKILDTDAGDDPSTFHTAKALVLTEPQDGEPATCTEQLVGLVGLHIGHKTQAAPQWIWSTFEHVANVPTQGQPIPAGAAYNFFIPDCTDCNAVNQPPPQPWDPHVQPVTADSGKSQVMRVIPIPDATVSMNGQVQAILGGTVWQNYELVSTQWPTNASGATPGEPTADNGWCDALDATDKSGVPAPSFLANTTLETYIQGTVPQASSSCINCHLNATMAAGQNSFSDFTYLLERAQ